jgi:hypothetical protein
MSEESWQEFAPPIQCEKGSPFKIIDENYRCVKAGRGWFDIENPDSSFDLAGLISPRNARLIAAAPDLLAALEHMVAVSNWATTIQSEEQYDAMIASAEAAIRKAKGE